MYTHCYDVHVMALFFSCDQAAPWMVQSVRLSDCLSVCLSHLSDYDPIIVSSYHHEIVRSYYQKQKWGSCKKSWSEVKGQGHKRSNPNFAVSGPYLQFEFTYDDKMMQKA